MSVRVSAKECARERAIASDFKDKAGRERRQAFAEEAKAGGKQKNTHMFCMAATTVYTYLCLLVYAYIVYNIQYTHTQVKCL